VRGCDFFVAHDSFYCTLQTRVVDRFMTNILKYVADGMDD
jgi:hypothetical protein